MLWKLARPRPGLREGVLLLVLAGLLAYSYIPLRRLFTADPVSQQLGLLRTGSAEERSTAATELARPAGKDTAGVVPALTQALQDKDPGVRLAAVNACTSHSQGPPGRGGCGSLDCRSARPRSPRACPGGRYPFDPQARPEARLAAADRAALPEADGPAAGSAPPPLPARFPPGTRSSGVKTIMPAPALSPPWACSDHTTRGHKTLLDLADDAVPEVRMVVARVLGEIGPRLPGPLPPSQADVRPGSLYSSKSHHRTGQLPW